MFNTTEKEFINHVSNYLPNRRVGRRGPKPVSKEVLVEQLFKKFKHGLRWRDLEHPTVCYNYFSELQRRGKFRDFFNFLTKDLQQLRQSKTIIDSSDMESYRTNGLVAYSGKYHNYCIKMTVEITPEYIPLRFCLSKGSKSDSHILDEMLSSKGRLP